MVGTDASAGVMTIPEHERRILRAMWAVAVGTVESRDSEARPLARAALEKPSVQTIQPLLDAGRNRAWLSSVIDVLVQVGIAAAEDVLGDEP